MVLSSRDAPHICSPSAHLAHPPGPLPHALGPARVQTIAANYPLAVNGSGSLINSANPPPQAPSASAAGGNSSSPANVSTPLPPSTPGALAWAATNGSSNGSGFSGPGLSRGPALLRIGPGPGLAGTRQFLWMHTQARLLCAYPTPSPPPPGASPGRGLPLLPTPSSQTHPACARPPVLPSAFPPLESPPYSPPFIPTPPRRSHSSPRNTQRWGTAGGPACLRLPQARPRPHTPAPPAPTRAAPPPLAVHAFPPRLPHPHCHPPTTISPPTGAG
jgi:hypothetical protein